VDVSILESGQQQATVQVDDFGVSSYVCVKLGLGHEGRNAALADQYRVSARRLRRTGKNTAAAKHDVRKFLHV
jgi:hypothetical protein